MPDHRCPQPPPSPTQPPFTRCSERAQSTIEFVGTLPLLALAATICVQAMLLACALVFAQTAADRAARDMPTAQVVEQVPAGWRGRVDITVRDHMATVRLVPPVLLPGTGRLLTVQATSTEPSS